MLVILVILEPSHYVLLIGWLVSLSSHFFSCLSILYRLSYLSVCVCPMLGDKQGSKFGGVMSIQYTHYILGSLVVVSQFLSFQ